MKAVPCYRSCMMLRQKHSLHFRTGFISAGDFAQGIRALKDDGCNVIVDDVTYITEPFFKDGVVSQAVDEVTGDGVSYFTAAGNYGNQSYQSAFHPVPAPAGLAGFAHNFSSGDIYQSLSLPAGTYTIVLQWDDSVYSLNPASGGAKMTWIFILLITAEIYYSASTVIILAAILLK